MSGCRVPLSDNASDPLSRLTRRREICEDRQSSHLKPMGLRKCQTIIVNLLTVRGSQKNIYTLTYFLSEEHSIQNIDIYQEIGNGHPPLNPSY